HVAAQLYDRVVAADAVMLLRSTARGEHDQPALHGVSPSSTMSPLTFTCAVTLPVGALRAIWAIRCTDSVVATPITQPLGDSRRSTARLTPLAPARYFSSAATSPHGVFDDSRTSTMPGSANGVSLPEKPCTFGGGTTSLAAATSARLIASPTSARPATTAT